MKIAIRGGHNYQATGSVALLNEVTEDRILTPIIIKYLRVLGHEVLDVTPGNCDVNSDLNYGVSKANNWGADLFVSIHLNKAYASYNGAIGSEVCVYSNIEEAQRVCNKLGALGFINRGQKIRPELYELKYTNMKAMIIEVCFIEATKDVELYKRLGHDIIAKSIAEGIGNKVVESTPQPSGEMYRVRKSWADASSQKSANKVLEYAIAECKKYVGYSVYDSKGNVKFTNGGTQPSKPNPQPPVQKPAPSKSKVDVFYKFDNLPWVKNLEDNAGLDGVSAKNLYVYPSKGKITFRVAKVGGNYYPWVSNVYDSLGRYDFAGNGVPIDRVQMKLEGISGYTIKYKVKLVDGRVLPWVYDCNDINGDGYAGIRGCAISNIWIEIESR